MPAKFVSNKDETIPLFENPWLERLSHIHPITPLVVFLPIVGWFLWQGAAGRSFAAVAGLVVAGLFIWTLTEYTLHRWVFHYQPKSTWGRHVHFLIHGIHHDYPRDSTRLVMPPPVSLPLAALFGLAFRGVFGASYEAIFAGFLIGYIIYDGIHYATHHWKMNGKVGGFLREYHLRHHFRDDDLGYGVSSPLWDYVFGTVATRTRADRKAA
ncbi:MAG TPA: sterol desaturase family protein [Gemmatimonadales bacterium]|nr:sterol desaturase family protein [Gemmatimonadales bacterium]